MIILLFSFFFSSIEKFSLFFIRSIVVFLRLKQPQNSCPPCFSFFYGIDLKLNLISCFLIVLFLSLSLDPDIRHHLFYCERRRKEIEEIIHAEHNGERYTCVRASSIPITPTYARASVCVCIHCKP